MRRYVPDYSVSEFEMYSLHTSTFNFLLLTNLSSVSVITSHADKKFYFEISARRNVYQDVG